MSATSNPAATPAPAHSRRARPTALRLIGLAEHAMPVTGEADQLSPDPARHVGDAGGPSMPAAKQPV
jgi:hypothetical protein